jgi:hypothetical protein
MVVSFEYGQIIRNRTAFTKILKDEWGPYGPFNERQFGERIKLAGNGIVAMYVDGKPAAILESILLRIDSVDQVPESFDFLTGNGTWRECL